MGVRSCGRVETHPAEQKHFKNEKGAAMIPPTTTIQYCVRVPGRGLGLGRAAAEAMLLADRAGFLFNCG